jgi:hypothetical protein
MSRINHPIKCGLAVSLSLAAIAPATVAATLTSRRARRDRRPRPYRSCMSHRTMASTRGDAGIGAVGGIGIAMLATGGGLVAVRMRRMHLDPATR